MVTDDILRGESKNMEFKEKLPKNSENYTKTVIAFANTQGGRLIFGIDDETRKVVGIKEEILFQVMDSISNAVSDSCEPQIIPSIEPCTIQGKTVILVTVAPEPHRPYYLKSKGKEKGTYIRVAGTTRTADAEKIKELEMEGARISWDELICVGYPVTEHAIKKLCRDMNIRRKEMQEQKSRSGKLPIVTRTNLENWNILKKTDGKYRASNAFVLLTSDFFPFSRTQCAVFKGKSRTVFLDKREYTGPVYEQIDEAVNFVLRNIRLGAKIEVIQRKEAYELPVEAIREMIINAHCHRNLTEESCIQVAVYDDRLEVTSPGGLYNGLTFEEALQGHSKIRNRAIANIFSQIGLVEAWGTGLQRIQNAAKEYGLPDPEFIEMPESFRVNLFRNSFREDVRMRGQAVSEHVGGKSDIAGKKSADVGEKPWRVGENSGIVGKMSANVSEKPWNVGENSEIVCKKSTNVGENSEIVCKKLANVGEKSGHVGGNSGIVGEKSAKVGEILTDVGDLKEKILRILSVNDRASAADIAVETGITKRTAERYIRGLREEGSLVRHGSPRGGYWEIVRTERAGNGRDEHI